MPIKVLGFAGSLREDSFNKKMVRHALHGAKLAGAETTFVDLRDLALPLYDEDLVEKHGIPKQVLELKTLLKTHQGLLIASPEFNGSLTAVLKNALDWASVSTEGEKLYASYRDKVCGIMSASPGAMGGLRGLSHLRLVLNYLSVMVLPEQWAVGKSHDAFDSNGKLKDSKLSALVEKLGARVVEVASKLAE